jgi:ribonuclease BN (tRNA processing enzyme)
LGHDGDVVELRVIGSGDAFGSGGRFQACLLLHGPGGDVLLDCGATSLVAMKRAGVDPSGIDHLIISHLHGDHFGGLPFLVLDGQFSRRVRPLHIAGPSGVRERVESAMEVFFPGSTTVARQFDVAYTELVDRIPARVGPVTVTPFAVDHASGAPAYALHVDYGGKSIAYSGDTAWTDALIAVARGADLFVCESYSFDKDVKYHLAYRRLLAERHRLDCRRILLTHMSADMLAHVDDADLDCAGDDTVIQL